MVAPRAYLGEKEIPRRFIELMTDTSSNDVRWLNLEESQSLGEVPSIAIWIITLCGAMSRSDQAAIAQIQMDGLKKPLSRDGQVLLETLNKRKYEVDLCTFNKIENARDTITEFSNQ
jgi:hypothetical protein